VEGMVAGEPVAKAIITLVAAGEEDVG